MQQVLTFFLPSLSGVDPLEGSVCVVIDVLRATTTIVRALASGASAVVPCLEIDQAQGAAAGLPAGTALLGGERSGGKIAGFDLGNSPSEYTPACVRGKTLVMTTTNGTRALHRARGADRVLLGSFLNLSATCLRLAGAGRVVLLCAGTDGQITREDVLLAGAIADRLGATGPLEMNDQTRIAVDAWQAVAATAAGPSSLPAALAAALRDTQGGRNLVGMGLEADLRAAAEIDDLDVVAQFDAARNRITLS